MCGQTSRFHLQRRQLHGLYTIKRTKSNVSWMAYRRSPAQKEDVESREGDKGVRWTRGNVDIVYGDGQAGDRENEESA